MSRLYDLVVRPEPCNLSALCLNSPEHRELGRCGDCRLATEGGGTGVHWRPADGRRQHPVLVEEKKQKSKTRLLEKAEARKNKDRAKQKLGKKAEAAEKKTQRSLASLGIRATKNSGRSHQDGDHAIGTVGLDQITLDTKLQTGNEHPVVKLTELEKIRAQAKAAGSVVGLLVLRNKFGRGVVVLAEEDLSLLLS